MVSECTGTRRNDGVIKWNGQEWYRNIPERAGMTPQRREKTLVQRQNKPQKHQNVLSRLTYTGMTKERTLIQRCKLRVKEYEVSWETTGRQDPKIRILSIL